MYSWGLAGQVICGPRGYFHPTPEGAVLAATLTEPWTSLDVATWWNPASYPRCLDLIRAEERLRGTLGTVGLPADVALAVRAQVVHAQGGEVTVAYLRTQAANPRRLLEPAVVAPRLTATGHALRLAPARLMAGTVLYRLTMPVALYDAQVHAFQQWVDALQAVDGTALTAGGGG